MPEKIRKVHLKVRFGDTKITSNRNTPKYHICIIARILIRRIFFRSKGQNVSNGCYIFDSDARQDGSTQTFRISQQTATVYVNIMI